MDPELENQIQQLNEVVSKQTSVMTDMVKALEDAQVAIVLLTTGEKNNVIQQRLLNTAIGGNINALTALQKAELERERQLEAKKALRNEALEGAGAALNSFGSAILSTQAGFTKYNSAINTVGNTAWQVGKQLGGVGIVAGGLINIFSKLLQYQTKQADNLLSASDSLEKMGAANALSVEQVRQMGRGAGLASSELDKMITPMQSVKGGFVSLGRTQAEGIKVFGEMIHANENVRRTFLKLGMGDQERIQTTADYVEYLNESGLNLKNQIAMQGGIANATQNYTKQMYVLADYAGMDVETAKKRVAAANANHTVLLFNADYQLKRNKLQEKANKLKDGAEKDAALREIKELDNKKEAFDKFTNGMIASGIKGDQLAAYQAQAITGVVTEASKSASVMNLNINGLMEGLEKHQYGEEEVTAQVSQAVRDTRDRYGDLALVDEKLAKATGLSDPEVLTQAFRRLPDEIRAAGPEAVKKYVALMNKQGAAGADPAQKARGDLVENERKLRLKFDDMAAKMNPLLGANGALLYLAAAATAAAAALSIMAIKDSIGNIGNIFKKGGGSGLKKDALGRWRDAAGRFAKAPNKGGFLKNLASGGSKSLRGVGRLLGKHAGWLGASGIEALDYATGEKKLTGRNVTGSVGGVAGGIAGAEAGAMAGAGIGALFGGVGAAPGALIGGFLGGAAGYFGGSKLATGAFDMFKKNGKNEKASKEAAKPQPPSALQTLKSLLDQTDLIQRYRFDVGIIQNNSSAMSSFIGGLTDLFGMNLSGAGSIIKFWKNNNVSDLFKKDGPIDAFKNFAKDDYGPNASENTDNLRKYAEAITAIKSAGPASGGSTGTGATTAAPAAGSVPHAAARPSGSRGLGEQLYDLGQQMFGGGGRPDEASISAQGKSVKVAKAAAPKFQALLDYMTKQGYSIRSLGGYINRDVRGRPGIKSAHSRGWAIDINPSENPLQEGSGPIKTDISSDIVSFARGQGLGWGGAWRSRRDAMHFSAQKNEGGFLNPQKAEFGGLFSEDAYYPNAGKKLAPLRHDSVLLKLAKTNRAEVESTAKQPHADNHLSINLELYAMITDKIDAMTRILENSHDKHNKILQAVQV